ncbi:hypothetical protein ACFQZJ_15860 [Maribacter chungangensis]|uniref:DUF1569 domain-containing protein n=1 Tax=Maribacter chungangensis TaxID=1069117 RepID=A0ABW3B6K2_9FLAO
MTEIQIQRFFGRIERLNLESKPSFGKMNVNQMVCHCADFYRMAKGVKKANEYGKINPNDIIAIAKTGKSVPAPSGFGQTEGEGTTATNLENDKIILKQHILEFSNFTKNYKCAVHPYLGEISNKRWHELAVYHLNHHLKQFGV